MFVGEDNRILTVASGRPEMPEKAPAVATVITRKALEKRGYRTLGEVLKDVPGYYIASKEYGHVLYSRGVPSGSLFLFDEVPFTTDSTKSIYPLDEDLGLEYVKRIEIIRGPASVLWGPDAFSGIINVVPLKGKDLKKTQLKIMTGTPYKDKKISILTGKTLNDLDILLYGSMYTKENIYGGYKTEFYELLTKLDYRDIVKLTARISHYHNPSKMSYKDISWTSYKEKPSILIKCEIQKKFDHTSLKAKGYFLSWNIKDKEDRFSWEYDNRIYYGELSLMQDLFNNRGLLVGGVSIRRNISQNSPINIRSFYPEYINLKFAKPLIIKKDFSTTLYSAFAQYMHHFKQLEIWAGIRYDKHTDYRKAISYNIGLGWFPRKWLSMKVMYGKAYRTPFAAQFLNKNSVDPEKIETINANINANRKGIVFDITAFYSRIKHHITEDLYGGYSKPSTQHIIGMELYSKANLFNNFNLWFDLTAIHHYGEKVKFKILDYILIIPPEMRYVYSFRERDFDKGPSTFGSLGIEWVPSNKLSLSLITRYRGAFNFKNLKLDKMCNYKHLWTTDVNLEMMVTKNIRLGVKAENIFNHRKYIPGTFSDIKTSGFKGYIFLKTKF